MHATLCNSYLTKIKCRLPRQSQIEEFTRKQYVPEALQIKDLEMDKGNFVHLEYRIRKQH